MKVIHVLDSLNRGGAEMLELDLCRNAASNGLDLTFVATGGGSLETEFAASGVEFIRLRRRLPVDPMLVLKLRELIKTRHAAVVHTHQAVEGIHAYLACLGTKTRVVLSFHGYVPDAKNRRTLQFLIPRTAANITVSREFKKWLIEKEHLGSERDFQVIYNGVDEKRLLCDRSDIKTSLGLSADTILYGMIGNFYAAPRKDQLTVCRALPQFFDSISDAAFVFVGRHDEGSDYEKCVKFCRQQGIADRVFFLGERDDIPTILKSLDVFVLSTRHESFGISAVEAMLVGVPTILSDIEPLLEISQNGKFASTFKTADPADLTAKMIELASNPDHRTTLAAQARSHAVRTFGISAHINCLSELYKSLFRSETDLDFVGAK